MPLFNSNQPASITGKVIFGDHIYFSYFFYLVFFTAIVWEFRNKNEKKMKIIGVWTKVIGDASRNVITHDDEAADDALRGRSGVRVSYEPRQ